MVRTSIRANRRTSHRADPTIAIRVDTVHADEPGPYGRIMETTHVVDARSETTRWLGLAAAGGAVVFALAFVAMHFIQPELNPIENWGSDYAFGPGGWVMRLGFIVAGAGALALTLGLKSSLVAGRRKRLSLVLMGLAGIGFIGSGISAH